MKKSIKRAISISMTLAMLAGTLTGAQTVFAEEGDTPTLTYWVKMDSAKIAPTTDNYSTIECYQQMMENTGINVEFIHPPVGQETDSFSLMLSGGEYPDLIHWDWGNSYSGGPDKAIEDGVILELTDLIEEYCPNLTAFLDQYPEIRAAMTTDSGNIYCFPNVYPYYADDTMIMCNRGIQIRQDWLDELGLEAPETIDEWYEVLTAFKEKGTTEDGSEIVPLVSRKMSEKTSLVRTFANAWNGLDYDFYVEDGTVKFGPIEEDFKEYLATMNQWYSEGLIAQEFSSYGGTEHDALVNTGQAGAWLSGLGAGMGVYITALGGDDSLISGVKFPVVEEGAAPKYTGADNSPFVGLGIAISSNCEDIEAACKWLDYHYSEEGSMLLNWGIEGVSYEIDENGEPQLTDEIMNNPDGLSADVALGKYAMVSQLEAFAKDDRVEATRMLIYPSQEEASQIWNATDFSSKYPTSVTLTSEEGTELANILSDITTYRDETVIRFIVGSESLDNYDDFVQTLKDMNIERAIEIKQAAYDRYLERMAAVEGAADTGEEAAADAVEEAAEETTEESAETSEEETAEEPAEDTAEDTTEEAAEEPAEDTAEEPVEEAAEEAAEE